MKRLLRIFFIVVLLVGIAYSLFYSPCPPAHRIIAHWAQDAADYEAGKITFEELIYRSDRLIECSEKLREEYLKDRRCTRAIRARLHTCA